jgi:hypothetical protein
LTHPHPRRHQRGEAAARLVSGAAPGAALPVHGAAARRRRGVADANGGLQVGASTERHAGQQFVGCLAICVEMQPVCLADAGCWYGLCPCPAVLAHIKHCPNGARGMVSSASPLLAPEVVRRPHSFITLRQVDLRSWWPRSKLPSSPRPPAPVALPSSTCCRGSCPSWRSASPTSLRCVCLSPWQGLAIPSNPAPARRHT